MEKQLEVTEIKLDKLLTQINDIREILNEISYTYDKRSHRSIELRLKVSRFLDELIADYMTELRNNRELIFEQGSNI